MKCNIADEQLISFLLKELPEHDQSELEEHISGCSICQARLKEFASYLEAWEDPTPIPSLLSDSFTDQVMNEIKSSEKTDKTIVISPAQSSFFHFLASSAAAFLLFYTGVFHEIFIWVHQFSNLYSETTQQFYSVSGKSLSWLNQINAQFSNWFQPFKF